MFDRLRNRGQRDTLASFFATAVRVAKDLPEEDWPENPRPHYMKEVCDAATEALEWLRARAEEVHVDASVIASRAVLTAWIDNPEDMENPLARGWRHAVAGRDIAEKFQV